MGDEVQRGMRVEWADCNNTAREGVVWEEAPTPRQWAPELPQPRPKGVKLKAYWVIPDEHRDGEGHAIMIRVVYRKDMTRLMLQESSLDQGMSSDYYQHMTLKSVSDQAGFINKGCRLQLPHWCRGYNHDKRYKVA